MRPFVHSATLALKNHLQFQKYPIPLRSSFVTFGSSFRIGSRASACILLSPCQPTNWLSCHLVMLRSSLALVHPVLHNPVLIQSLVLSSSSSILVRVPCCLARLCLCFILFRISYSGGYTFRI